MPLRHGFERYFGPAGGGVDYWYHCEWDGVPMLYENDKPVRREGYMTDLITDGAVGFLRGYSGEKPLFLYVPYTAPHTPLQVPDRKPPAARTRENWNEGSRQTYAAVVERLDMGIGKILAAVREKGLADNTLVVFFSDNGGTRTARNAPFSGYKGGLMEGGIRVPCMVRWPGVLPRGKTSVQTTASFDLTRSILAAAGAAEPKGRPLDGIDVLARIAAGEPPVERTLFWRQRRGDLTWRAVRDGNLKYVSRTDAGEFEEHVFDLAADPAEQSDLSARRPEETRRLKRLLADWEAEVAEGRP
jgi:N-acetylgalactosamine-6-sulfatase